MKNLELAFGPVILAVKILFGTVLAVLCVITGLVILLIRLVRLAYQAGLSFWELAYMKCFIY